MAHLDLLLKPNHQQINSGTIQIYCLRIGQGQHTPESSNHCFTSKMPHSGYPEEHFRENQLIDGSISLSPLYSSMTNDLHTTTTTSLHPLRSSFSNIVRQISGPNANVLTQTCYCQIGQLVKQLYEHLLSLCPQVCPPLNLHRC